jgi:hypothetical protein
VESAVDLQIGIAWTNIERHRREPSGHGALGGVGPWLCRDCPSFQGDPTISLRELMNIGSNGGYHLRRNVRDSEYGIAFSL